MWTAADDQNLILTRQTCRMAGRLEELELEMGDVSVARRSVRNAVKMATTSQETASACSYKECDARGTPLTGFDDAEELTKAPEMTRTRGHNHATCA